MPNTRCQAIIFDFDYTLADSSRGIVECINYALTMMGQPPCSEDACHATIGLSLPETLRTLTGLHTPEQAATFVRHFTARADVVMVPSATLYPGVPDLLRRLTGRGLTLGILSSKYAYRIRQILDGQGIVECFAAIVGGEDVQRPKPDPQGLHRLLNRLGQTAEQVILVGDSLVDAQTAQAGAVRFIAVLQGTTNAQAFAPYRPLAVLGTVSELDTALGSGISPG